MRKKIRVFFQFLRFAYRSYKPYFFVVSFKAITSMANTLFNVYSLTLVLNAIAERDFRSSLMLAGLIVGVNLFFNFLNLLITRMMNVCKLRIQEAINRSITGKLMRVPFQYLEDPYYLDLKERAKFACENQDSVGQFLESVAIFIQILFTLAGLLTILISFDLILVSVLIAAVLINVGLTALTLKTQFSFYRELMPINRRFGYYLNTLGNEKNAKDFRIYSIGAMMNAKFKKYADTTDQYFVTLFRKFMVISSLGEFLKYIEMAFVYAFVAVRTISRNLTIGSFSLYISSALVLSTNLSRLIDVILSMAQYANYLTPFVELMELHEEKDDGLQIPFEGEIQTLEVKNVTFSYPKTENIILNDISFTISRGQKISIVGLNGAGKTTLIKLICRLYHPNKGSIEINGVSIYDYEYKSYIRQISAVFQDYKLFAYSLKENILNEDGDPAVAKEIADRVGLKEKIESLPEGIETLYSKVYDEKGIELSGGEAQKVAIARALYKNASLVILDEPTSALDPLAEAEIYQHFNELVHDKTAIYISHRMSSSVFCDKILILDKGIVADYDTHAALMKKKKSLYYQLFSSQAKNYKIETK